MRVVSNSITMFVVDVSAPMASPRQVEDTILSSDYSIQTRTRQSTDLQWVCEFVSAKLAEIILRALKTTKVSIITYGSSKTLDLVQSLRAVHPDEDLPPGDALAALVDAIQLSTCPEKGGIKDSQKNTWKRTIYLITDGRSKFSWDGSDAIKEKLKAEGIQLRVLGIDFDDSEVDFAEENKKETKRSNEKFWHSFLADIPEARIATALDAIEQANLPAVQIPKPTPTKLSLTFGDSEDVANKESLHVPIVLYKMTDVQRPMAQAKISKLVKESAAATKEEELELRKRDSLVPSSTPVVAKMDVDDDGPTSMVTYKADIKREYFLLDDVGSTEHGKDKAKPLAAGAEERFTRAWKLGASLIPVEYDAFGSLETKKGVEILHFSAADTYRREYNLDQIWYIFADPAQPKAQLELSSFVRGLSELDLITVVRLVRRDGGEPELGVLMPCVAETYDCFFYSRVPFREDVRRFIFPPLDRVITKEGQELRQAPSIPTKEDKDAMDAFVNSMDLTETGGDGQAQGAPWFDILDSFNPAIHTLKSAVRHRFLHPDDQSVPGPHPDLVKFFQPPKDVQKRAFQVIQACRDRFRVDYVPSKGNLERKKRDATAMHGQDAEAREKQEAPVPSKLPKLDQPQAADDNDSDATEDEAEATDTVKAGYLSQAVPNTPPSGDIHVEDPVADFMKQVETDDVTVAMVQMLEMIRYLLGMKAYDKVQACMRSAKKVAQEYEEAMRWNTFVRSLKREILAAHESFWDEKLSGQHQFGLVTEKEDEADQSDVTVEDANDFIENKDA